jgi:hypothetical protein
MEGIKRRGNQSEDMGSTPNPHCEPCCDRCEQYAQVRTAARRAQGSDGPQDRQEEAWRLTEAAGRTVEQRPSCGLYDRNCGDLRISGQKKDFFPSCGT